MREWATIAEMLVRELGEVEYGEAFVKLAQEDTRDAQWVKGD